MPSLGTFHSRTRKQRPSKKTPIANLTPAQESKATEVEEFWDKFRNFNVDRLPVQVKILGIWTALCNTYRVKICFLGHHSGFIEAAGLIGIPVFYLNNERNDISIDPELSEAEMKRSAKIEQEQKHKEVQREKLFWKASVVARPKDGRLARLRELADVLNTFIPVGALEHDARIEDGKKGKKVFHIEADLEKELLVAIFMYTCCRVEPGLPAWTVRVEMMHQAAETDQEEAPAQRWLYERWCFATGRAEQVDELPTATGLRHQNTEADLKLSLEQATDYYALGVKSFDGRRVLVG